MYIAMASDRKDPAFMPVSFEGEYKLFGGDRIDLRGRVDTGLGAGRDLREE